MFVTLTLNPTLDCTVTVAGTLRLNGVHKATSEVRTPGGKGINVAKAIAANGAAVWAGGILGEDQQAFFEGVLAAAGIRTAFLTVPHPTRSNLMLVDGHEQELKLNRPGFPDLRWDWPALSAYCLDLAGKGDVVVLSGSLPDPFPPNTYRRLIDALSRAGKTVVLDTSGEAMCQGIKARPAVIKPNRAEFETLIGRRLHDEPALVRELGQRTHDHEVVIVSDGERGAYFATADRILHAVPPTVRVADTTGAGDTLVGQFCARYFPARRLDHAVVAEAVAAGTAAVEQRGTPCVPLSRIRELATQTATREIPLADPGR